MAKQSGDNWIGANQGRAASVSQADEAGWPNDLERAQIYALIDSILPFEACLYYQVAPLSIDGSCLTMGTVDPDDPAATEYVTKQLSYINYSIRFEKIESDWHRDLLSQYLKHTAESQQQANAASHEVDKAAAEADKAAAEAAVDAAASAASSSLASEAAIAHETEPIAGAAISDEQMQATLILEQVEEMTAMLPRDLTSQLVAEERQAAALAEVFEPAKPPVSEASAAAPAPAPTAEPEVREGTPTTSEVPPVIVPPSPEAPPSTIAETTPESASPAAPPPSVPSPPPEPPAPVADATTDEAHDDDISRLLCALPPKVLMQALLDKVIGDGIGRLYLKRHGHSHQILWSRNGVLEGLIEPVESQVLQAVINELKQLTHMSVALVTQPKQVEIERTQDGQRILLRLKIIPGDETEQATLQVLRGAALEFHQQYQIDSISRDALDAAETLKARLSDMRDRARKSLNFQPSRSKTLKSLVKLLKELDIQMQEIEAAYHAHEDE
ncbi:hypothetical protein [Halomicronema sp. CCY15110]|uniref:hypothetical protein n=1 Tax=Halomicronema sp. CCY15110 TaxID=2767773 RepID=UPI0019522E22|nr:hypothetical protein [Halomicronema sp. CCY15110]